MYKDSTSGNIIKANVELVKLEVGIEGLLFQFEWRLPHLLNKKSWVAETKEFCWANNIDFAERGTHLQLKCINDDKMIMETLIKSHRYSPGELSTLNRCRMHLKVLALSDITSGDGKYLLDTALSGSRVFHNDTFNWATQARLPKSEWAMWVTELRQHFVPEQD